LERSKIIPRKPKTPSTRKNPPVSRSAKCRHGRTRLRPHRKSSRRRRLCFLCPFPPRLRLERTSPPHTEFTSPPARQVSVPRRTFTRQETPIAPRGKLRSVRNASCREHLGMVRNPTRRKRSSWSSAMRSRAGSTRLAVRISLASPRWQNPIDTSRRAAKAVGRCLMGLGLPPGFSTSHFVPVIIGAFRERVQIAGRLRIRTTTRCAATIRKAIMPRQPPATKTESPTWSVGLNPPMFHQKRTRSPRLSRTPVKLHPATNSENSLTMAVEAHRNCPAKILREIRSHTLRRTFIPINPARTAVQSVSLSVVTDRSGTLTITIDRSLGYPEL